MTWTEREGSKEAMHGQWRKKQYLSACIGVRHFFPLQGILGSDPCSLKL